MEYTLEELKERLKTFEETYLLELLQASSEDLVDRFSDIIESRMEQFMSELSEDEEEE